MRRAALVALATVSACSSPAPPPAAVFADTEARDAVASVARQVEAARRGADSTRAVTFVELEQADVAVVVGDASAARLEADGWALSPVLVRAPLVAVGPGGARPEPSLAEAVRGRRVALPLPGTAAGQLARDALADLDGVLDARLDTVSVDDPAAAVAAGQAEAALALAPQALSATRLAVTFRPGGDASVRVAVRPGAPAEAEAFARALAAPEAFRVWAASGFSPPR